MSVAEQLQSRTATKDGWQYRTSRTFHVVTPDGNADPLIEPGLPAHLSPDPIYPSALCRGLAVSQKMNSTNYFVVANYSTERFGKLAVARPQTFIGYKHWSLHTDIVKIERPGFEKVFQTTVEGGTATTRFGWKPKAYPTFSTRLIYKYKLNVQSINSTQMKYITSQIDKFHLFPDGNHYQFKGGSLDHSEDTKIDITYDWWYDNGNEGLVPIYEAITGDLVLPPPRPPWMVYVTTPRGLDAQGNMLNPVITTRLTYTTGDIIANGWQNLPGNPTP